MKRAALCIAVVTATIHASCTKPPAPGEFGKLRFVGKVEGEPPLRLYPPTADAVGNVYTLNGSLDRPQVNAYVSRAGGGETGGCNFTKGDKYGAHGWVGFAGDHAWYWSGDALVFVGPFGACARVLDRDPGTDVSLAFRAVMPWVRDAPSRTTAIAYVQSPVDPAPFSVLVDLNLKILSNIRPFDPADATNVQIIGVGGHREKNVGFVLLQYDRGDGTVVEGRFFDADAQPTARAPINGGPFDEYGIRGYLSINDGGLVEGLLADGRLVAFDRSGGKVLDAPGGMTPVGVHEWSGKLWLVGVQDGRPVVAEIDDGGRPGPAQRWTASETAAGELTFAQDVTDDRSLPSRTITWTNAKTAIGDFPFLSPFSLTHHAEGTTLWLIAGPGVDLGGAKQTSFAMAPVGVSYP